MLKPSRITSSVPTVETIAADLAADAEDSSASARTVFMACAAKSNAVYAAFNAAKEDATSLGSLEVPLHLRNAPTRLMKEIGYGKGYRYAHDEPDAYAAGERYFPEGMPERRYYLPVPRGLEIKIGEALASRRARDKSRGAGGS